MANKKSTKILTTQREIMDYLSFSEILFKKFLARGLPVVILDGRYYAHADNLDDYFKIITRRQSQGASDSLGDQE